MNNINSILKNKVFVRKPTNRPINENYEIAKEFGLYVGLPIPIVMRMFKKYGRSKVLAIRGFLYDYPVDHRGKIGIAYWKLKENDKLHIPPQEQRLEVTTQSARHEKTGENGTLI